MSKLKSIEKRKFPVEILGGWDAWIAEAKQRIQDLEFSIKIFERKKAAGEPCPAASPQSDSEMINEASRTPAKGAV
jgi:hypothetical protein